MTALNAEQLKKMVDPLVDPALGRVANVVIDAGRVMIALDVDRTRARELEPLRQSVQSAVEKMPQVKEALVVLTAEAPAPALKTTPQVQHKTSSRPVAPGVKNIIAVASGKGGVGKSTVAANLAVALSRAGKSTGLLDADIYGASQPRMMGHWQKPETDKEDMIVPPVVHGIKLMSMGFFVDPASPVIWRGPMVHSAIQQLFRDVAWGALDVLVVDLPPGTGDAQLSLAQNVPLKGAVIVSTPQDVALSEAKKGLAMFQKTNVPILGLIENMSYHVCSNCGHHEHIFGHGGVREEAKRLGVSFLGEVPLHVAVREQADSGQPIVAALPDHPASAAFRAIAEEVLASIKT